MIPVGVTIRCKGKKRMQRFSPSAFQKHSDFISASPTRTLLLLFWLRGKVFVLPTTLLISLVKQTRGAFAPLSLKIRICADLLEFQRDRQ